MEVPSTVSSADIQSEDDQAAEGEGDEDPLNWQKLVSRGVLESLTPKEIKRQEVINGESSAFRPLNQKRPNWLTWIHVFTPQSCSTRSALTCACWGSWTVFSARGWTETPSFLLRTSDKSLLTWRRSSSCTVTLNTQFNVLPVLDQQQKSDRLKITVTTFKSCWDFSSCLVIYKIRSQRRWFIWLTPGGPPGTDGMGSSPGPVGSAFLHRQ